MVSGFTNPQDHEWDNLYLSQEDVTLLMHEDSADTRINVLDKISRNYNAHKFSEREQQFAEEIFRLLMRDTELRVRQILAEKIKDNDSVPRDIMLHLAKDTEQVAIPVLQASSVLSDADLVHIVENSRQISKLVAISKRHTLSERVSHALIETHYPQVVRSLLDNESAEIPSKDHDIILQEFHDEPSILETMAKRGTLPLAAAEKLVGMVSESVAAALAEKYNIDSRQLGQQTRDHLTLDLMPLGSSDEEIETAITQMIAYDRLSPSIILTSLCRGHLRFFEIALAKLARIPKANARKLIRDRGSLGFQALYHKTKLPESTFDAVRLLLHSIIDAEQDGEKPGTPHYANVVVERMLQRAGGREIENLPYILALVRQSVSSH